MNTMRVMVIAMEEIARKGLEAAIEEFWDNIVVEYSVQRLELGQRLLTEHEIDIVLIDDGEMKRDEVLGFMHWCQNSKPALGLLLITRRRNPFYLRDFACHPRSGILLREEISSPKVFQALKSFNDQMAPHSRMVHDLIHSEIVRKLERAEMEDRLHLLRLLDRGLTVEQITRGMQMSKSKMYRIKGDLHEIFNMRDEQTMLDVARQMGLFED